jgi:hypothetical protein
MRRWKIGCRGDRGGYIWGVFLGKGGGEDGVGNGEYKEGDERKTK